MVKAAVAYFESLPGHSYGGTEQNHEDAQRSLAEILTGSYPNTYALMSEANCWIEIVHKHEVHKIAQKKMAKNSCDLSQRSKELPCLTVN